METLPITLIVKAPNQQIEDQTIKCELSWTINKLKQHLSEVYPSKPLQSEQKLIYSGQLLNDSVTLREVLRQYDGQETHTVHLVCTPRHPKLSMPEAKITQIPPTNPAVAAGSTTTTTTSIPTRPPQTTTEQQPNIPQNIPWTNGAPMDPNQYALQMAWMQQAYLQYMTQYMQLAANSYGTAPTMTQPAAGPIPEPPPQQQLPPEQPAPGAAPAPAQRDPENPERDWLDVFYMLSRVLVLFSVVYFYSSPLRFVFVLLLAFTIYLYQIGFFRNINNNNNNNNNVAPPEQPVPQEEQAPSRLMVVWTFFATFFASLIPEIPNAV